MASLCVACCWAVTFEQAAFRVQDRAFYISDMNGYITDINSFICLMPNSLFMRGVSHSGKKIIGLGKKMVDIKARKELFYMVTNIVILSRFIQEKERGKLRHFRANRCYKGRMSRDLKGLLRTEIFLQDRFKHSGKAADIMTIKTFIAGLRKKTDYEIFD